jgi:predicted phage-related endonuclease
MVNATFDAPPIDRTGYIGGSDIAAILGLSPYKTPLDVYLEKRGLWEDGAAGEAARWGTIMEPILAG